MRSLGKLKLLGIFIPFFAIFFMSHNTYAATLGTSGFDLYRNTTNNGTYSWRNGILYNSIQWFDNNGAGALRYQFSTPSQTFGGNYATIHFETNIVAQAASYSDFAFVNLAQQDLIVCNAPSANVTYISKALSYQLTNWTDNSLKKTTLTFYGDYTFKINSGSSSTIVCAIGSTEYQFFRNYTSSGLYFEQNPASISYTNSETEALLNQQINQNNIIINQNQAVIDQNNSAYDAIGGQSASDISGANNQATTNLIGILSSFLTQLQSFSATNCNLVLPFPEFIGGSQTVNICQGKDVLGNFITVIGTLAMVTFYIPLAYMLLKMIYNEIRSFTNG